MTDADAVVLLDAGDREFLARTIEVDGGGEVSWLTMCQLLLNANLPGSSEPEKPQEPPMPVDLVALVADLIPRPQVSERVADWPDDEVEFYRLGDPWLTNIQRADRLARMRQEKAARAILAALKIEPGHRPAGVHDHSSTDPWTYRPGGDTAYLDGCPVTPLTPEQAMASAVGSARLAGHEPDPEWAARVAEAVETPGGVDVLIAERVSREADPDA